VFFARRFARTPTLIDFDVTPVQLDAMEAYGGSTDPKPVAALKWRLSNDMFHARGCKRGRTGPNRASSTTTAYPPSVIVNPPGVDLVLWRPDHEPVASDGEGVLSSAATSAAKEVSPPRLASRAGRRCRAPRRHPRDVAAAPDLYVYRDMQPNTDELLNLYRRADLFVLPSLGECFGIATVEAMAAGLTVIASDVGGTADIIEHGGNGFIAPAGDGRTLAGQIATILEDDALRTAMARRSRELAESRFDVDRNARRTLSVLKSMVRRDD
jgi:hypothetical protein